jgi:REP element-mobilizing transposase RayT
MPAISSGRVLTNRPASLLVKCQKPDRQGGQHSLSCPMSKKDYIDFQECSQALGFLITFRTYGTWLHGEDRGSVDRRNYNRYGTPGMPSNKRLLNDEIAALRHAPVVLNPKQRKIVEDAIREVCDQRKYTLHALNARSNHVHSVVTAPRKPEFVLNSFKSYATRKLRETDLLDEGIKPWSRHGSTPYLWIEDDVQAAIDYVINGQGDEPFR